MNTAATPEAERIVKACREVGRIELGMLAVLQDLVNDAQDMEETAVVETIWLAHGAITEAMSKLGECCIILEGH